MGVFNEVKWVSKTPIVTTFLLEWASIGQSLRMYREQTAAGQSLTSWICVFFALALWWNFYRVITPNEKLAKWSTVGGMTVTLIGIGSVVYWRYLA